MTRHREPYEGWEFGRKPVKPPRRIDWWRVLWFVIVVIATALAALVVWMVVSLFILVYG